jgi:hypothetical protein
MRSKESDVRKVAKDIHVFRKYVRELRERGCSIKCSEQRLPRDWALCALGEMLELAAELKPINSVLQKYESRPILVGGCLTGIVDNCLSGSSNEVLADPGDNLTREQLPLVVSEYCSLELQAMSTLPAALHSVVRDSSPAFTVVWLIYWTELS